MAKRQKKKTTYGYSSQRKRIQQTIYRLKKKGYTSQLYFPTENELRKQGIKGKELARLTVKLKKWTSKSITAYIKAENIKDKADKEKKERYADFTDMVIREYKNQISRFPKKVAEIILLKLDEAIKKSGKDNVAYALQYKNEHLSEYLSNVALFGDSIQAILAYCDAMFGDLPGMDAESRLEISDIIDSESYSE